MKARKKLDSASVEDQSINYSADADMPAGYITCEDYSWHPKGKRLAELRDLDLRLRRPQSYEDRLALYREIIQRDDLGDGYSICFGNDIQNADFHCEEQNILMDQVAEARQKEAEARQRAADVKTLVREGMSEHHAEQQAPDMLDIRQAAEYANVTTKTIGNWIKTEDADGPILKGIRGKGRLTRIPRQSLDRYKKPEKITIQRKPKQKKRTRKKTVKRK
jgi:hypothetical protein